MRRRAGRARVLRTFWVVLADHAGRIIAAVGTARRQIARGSVRRESCHGLVARSMSITVNAEMMHGDRQGCAGHVLISVVAQLTCYCIREHDSVHAGSGNIHVPQATPRTQCRYCGQGKAGAV